MENKKSISRIKRHVSRGVKSAPPAKPATGTAAGWTFFSNHSHVLFCLAGDPMMLLRDVAARVGVTERAVLRIVAELEDAGVLKRMRQGRRNRYEVQPQVHLRHSVEAHCTVRDLLDLVNGRRASRGRT
jgi:hypothetical protein